LRNATVTSLTTMEVISIEKEDYIDIFMSNKSEEPEHVKYLATCLFTKGWPLEKLKQSPSSCVIHYYKYKKRDLLLMIYDTLILKIISYLDEVK
jgi:hypothetical protein